MTYLEKYQKIRKHTMEICQPLQKEDYVLQPIVDVSPPKWHLAHTTWFFEAFILKQNMPTYLEFDPDYNFLFNSYYETIGERVSRDNRGALSRPTVDEIVKYRHHVDEAMHEFLSENINEELRSVLETGLHHEQQHQELLLTDIKYILGHNPLFPAYDATKKEAARLLQLENKPILLPAGIYEIGYDGPDFCFDNERKRHKVYLNDYAIDSELITNDAYFKFIESGGYHDFRYWHADGWDWIKKNNIEAPLYWHKIDNEWHEYTLSGLHPLDPDLPVCHVSYYEAAAFAAWVNMRLPTEAEWEAAAEKFNWGERWEWTESAYLPYPGFLKAEGAIGEYNGKFMINQMILRGASIATPPGHSRVTYRNFFQAHLRWQFTGIRLAQTINL